MYTTTIYRSTVGNSVKLKRRIPNSKQALSKRRV